MKAILLKGACLGFLALLSVSARPNRETADPPPFITVEFMKVLPGKGADYDKLEHGVAKKFHQARREKGQILSWYWYAVNTPYGTERPYDFVTVTFYKDANTLENRWSDWDALLKAAKLSPEETKIAEQVDEIRHLVRGEVSRHVDGLPFVPSAPPAKYLAVNYMKVPPGGESAYIEMEQKVFKPFHLERQKNGKLSSWSMFELQMPWGMNDRDYNYVTVDHYDRLEQRFGDNMAEWNKINGKLNPDETMKKLYAARELVHGELWQLMDYVQ